MLSSLIGSLREFTRSFRRSMGRSEMRRRRSSFACNVELAETRVLLSSHSLSPISDGVVADRDLDGVFEYAESSATSVTNRWFDFGGIGQERSVFEFDLAQFAPGSVVTSAKLGMYVTSFTSGATSGPTLAFSLKTGDGSITVVDGDGAGVTAGAASVSSTGYREFSLTASAFASVVGGKVAVRVSNSALSGHWISAASSEDSLFTDPVLIVDVAAPTLDVSINPNVLNEDGSVPGLGTVTRTGELSQALTVNLSSSDTTEISVPATVIIPAGASSAQFAVTAVDDVILDGTQTATVTARATLVQGTSFAADTTFGTNGIATTRTYTTIQPSRAAMTPLADGKYLIASEVSGGTSWQILRYNANGTLDTTFGSGGSTTTSFGSVNYPVPHRIVVQSDGKILVGGKFAGGVGTAALARYNANGTIDTSFGVSGKADLANLGGWIEDIAVRADGRILLAAAMNGTVYFRVAGLTSNGQFDSNFGVKTYTSINAAVKAIELLDDGSFIMAGGKAIAKFTAAGSIDTSYGTNGVTNIGLTIPEYANIFDAKLGADGKLSLGMYRYSNATQNTNNTTDMAALRLTASGAIDATFGSGAIQVVDFSGFDDVPNTMVLQSDGKILLGGYTEIADNNRDMAMVRFNVDGSLDATFDGDGRFRQNVISYTGEMVTALAQQADGKLVSLAGWSNDYRLLRYHSGTENVAPQASTTVTVLDNENAPPRIEARTFQIPENLPAGTDLGQVVAYDPDAGQALTYSITASELPGAFAIDASSGVLSVADGTLLNYEAVTSVLLTVTVTDNGTPNQSGNNTITVNLNDVNERPNVAPLQLFDVDENAANGTVVGSFVGSDPDAGQTLTWQITEASLAGAFAINAATGQITVADRTLLDYEILQAASLTVLVSDNQSPALSTTAIAGFTIRNINEAPVLHSLPYSVDENAASNSYVGRVFGTDPDFGQQFAYAITGSSAPGAFDIDELTGEIFVGYSALLSFEASPSISIDVQISDNGVPVLATTGTLTISLRDLNESPVIQDQAFSVAENSAVGTIVGTALASDPDSGQSLTYSITETSLPGAFSVNSLTGRIIVADSALLNHENVSTAQLTIAVSDNANPQLSASANVTVNITNLNEAPFIADASFAVREYLNSGLTVGYVDASDPDAGQTLRYSIVDQSVQEAFMIRMDTGEIIVWHPAVLDYETVQSITVTVRATDSANPALSSTATVIVNINDVNESPVMGAQSFSVAENAANGTVLGTINGSDVDQGQALTWTIFSSPVPGAFAVDPASGVMTVADGSLLNFESRTSIQLAILLSDNGVPVLATFAPVTISVTDINETPSLSDGSFTLDENAANGTAVGFVAGADPDADQSLIYTITSTTLPGAFSIDASTGQITVLSNAQLNFEAASPIVLTVTATDNGTPSRSDSGQITISLRDLNERPALAAQSFAVNENSANGTEVGQVVASDVDAGQSLTYTILSGNTSGAFSINSATGQITVANTAVLDFETTPTFFVSVRVTDNGNPSLSHDAVMTINLNDVSEVLAIGLDVVPGNSTNTFRRNAKFEVAILSTASFDARNVAVSSVRFGKLGTEDSVVRDKRGNRIFSYRDVNGDGRLDLVLQIDAAKTGLQVGDTLARLTAELQNGMDLFGSSSVVVKK